MMKMCVFAARRFRFFQDSRLHSTKLCVCVFGPLRLLLDCSFSEESSSSSGSLLLFFDKGFGPLASRS